MNDYRLKSRLTTRKIITDEVLGGQLIGIGIGAGRAVDWGDEMLEFV